MSAPAFAEAEAETEADLVLGLAFDCRMRKQTCVRRLQDCHWIPGSIQPERYRGETAAARQSSFKVAPKILSKNLFKFKYQLGTYHYLTLPDL